MTVSLIISYHVTLGEGRDNGLRVGHCVICAVWFVLQRGLASSGTEILARLLSNRNLTVPTLIICAALDRPPGKKGTKGIGEGGRKRRVGGEACLNERIIQTKQRARKGERKLRHAIG